ncbi:MAG: hypothetical protein QOI66_3383, partial [Myxococcales bacterium]|nr:hypothetical protein [Myxococcales bacterium]
LSPRKEDSACITGRPQTLDAIGATLTGQIAFRDLAEGPVALRLQAIEMKAAGATSWGCADWSRRP